MYRSVHEETGRVVAVKVLRKRFREDLAEREQFLREGRMGLNLQHPNVVPIYEVTGDRIPYMAMEFVEGQTLRQMVRMRGKLDVLTSMKLTQDIMAGLAYAAEQGITHRDLKMSNVLVSASGRAKLVDFGLAAAVQEGKELADCPNARAIDYAALERGTGVRKDDARSDLFFAGCIAYTILTGKSPLIETRDRIQRLNFSRFSQIPAIQTQEPSLPAIVVRFVQRAMEVNPNKRYDSAAAMFAEARRVVQRLKTDDQAAWAPLGSDDGQWESQKQDAGAGQQPEENLEGENRTIMIVEAQTEMQNLLREKLKQRGYRVLITNSPGRAGQRFEDAEEETTPADCVIFSALQLGTEAVEAFNAFGENPETSNVPAIFFADRRQKSLISQAKLNDHRLLLTSPLKMRALRVALLKLFKAAAPQQS